MPARPNVPGVVQIVMHQTIGEDLDVINRFYQKYSGTPGSLSDGGALAWATECAQAWEDHLHILFANNVALQNVTLTDLSTNVGGFGTFDSTNVGSGGATALPAGTAMCIRQHIERRYRGGHPRQYMGGLTPNQLHDPQTWDSTFVADWQTAYTAFRAECATGCPTAIGPAVDVNVSFFTGFTNHTFPSGRVRPIPNLRPTPLVDIIASFSVNPKVASQRRRNLQSL